MLDGSPVVGKKVIKHIITPDESQQADKLVMEFIASDLGLESIPASIDGLPAEKLFITIDDNNKNKYILNRTKNDSYAGWFTTATYVSPVVIGKYTLVGVDSSLDIVSCNQRLTEVKDLLTSAMKEKMEMLAKSCDFESQVNALNVENNTLKVIINSINREIDALNNKQDDAQIALNQRMAQLEANISHMSNVKKTKVNPRIEHKRIPAQKPLPSEDSIISALKKFDKNSLRPINLTMSHLY
jgi:hypothetical protein